MSGRTEQPTARRLEEARRRGDVARSRWLAGAAATGAGLLAVAAAGEATLRELAGLLRATLAAAPEGGTGPGAALGEALRRVLALSALPCGAALTAAVTVGAVQVGLRATPAALALRPERLSPAAALARLAAPRRLAEGALALAGLAALGAAAWGWGTGVLPALATLPRASAPVLPAAGLVGALAARLVLVLALLGAADLLLARHLHLRSLRMTRDEVRRESREQEGDPAFRAERRRRHRALLAAGPVTRATCLVVNPTHVAVALRHRRGADEAPRVLAAASGPGARRLRSQARRAGVPIVHDPPLARALLALATVGEEIPEPLYDAAAALLARLYAAPAAAGRAGDAIRAPGTEAAP